MSLDFSQTYNISHTFPSVFAANQLIWGKMFFLIIKETSFIALIHKFIVTTK